MIPAAREARASLSGSRLPVVASMQERLQRDEEASDEGHDSGLQERRRASLTTEACRGEPVEAVRSPDHLAISKAVSIPMAPTAASTKKSAGKLAPKITAATFAAISRNCARSTRRRAATSVPRNSL